MSEMNNLSMEAEIAHQVLTTILKEMDFPAEIGMVESENEIAITITSERPLGILIGKGGQTLDALELLVKQITHHKIRQYGKHIQLDAEGYREKHANRMMEGAREIAREVIESSEEAPLESMNARDRRLIHMAVKEFPELETYSLGEEPNRYIVICLKGQAQPE
jgi:spoIIIJ-associated protein